MANNSIETDWVKPGFIVAGSAKCGTTSVFHYANQHPDIYLPRKESFYFISSVHSEANRADPLYRRRVVSSLDEYKLLFNGCSEEKVAGEIATGYLYYYKYAIPEIKRVLGDPGIVIILRNPVERAYSGYMHLLKSRVTGESFVNQLQREEYYKQNHYDFMWYLISLGLYSQQVKAYIDNFSNVKIMLFDDLKINATAFMKEFFGFVGVDSEFIPDTSVRYNTSGIPSDKVHNKFLYHKSVKRLLGRCAKLFLSDKSFRHIRIFLRDRSLEEIPELSAELSGALFLLYRDDIQLLQGLVDKNLTPWLNNPYLPSSTASPT